MTRTMKILAALALGLLTSCGYTVGFGDGGGDGRRVAIDVVGSQSFRQRLEIPLSRELHRVLQVQSGYRPTSHDRADAILQVEVTEIRGQNLIPGGATPIREGALDYAVQVRLTDAETGAVLREMGQVDRGEFRVAVGETQATAVDEIAADLARKIILALEAGNRR